MTDILNMEWLNKHFDETGNVPRPNWESISEHVEQHLKDEEQNKLWCEIALTWMENLKSKLSGNYHISESDNYILVTSESERYDTLLKSFLERSKKNILSTLKGIASDEGFGKYVVIVFNDIDDYYSYMSHFYAEDGEFGLSSGVYINNGYGHFAFPLQEIEYAESIAAHEMTHSFLSHLPLPLWLDEGLAVTLEDKLTGSAPLIVNNDILNRHKAFWGENEIQEFWSGDSFRRSDEGQKLSYHLAQLAVKSLSHDFNAFTLFANKANFVDGGEAAANEIFGGSLGDLIEQFLDEGDWSPKPQEWNQEVLEK